LTHAIFVVDVETARWRQKEKEKKKKVFANHINKKLQMKINKSTVHLGK
jgi:hypothetical protein